MLNNLINRHDFEQVLVRIRQGHLWTILSKLTSGSKGKVVKSWGQREMPPKNWWNIPEIQQRMNLLASSEESVDFREYVSRKYLGGRQGLVALSLGCGAGQHDVHWARCGNFRRIDGYDISGTIIDAARQNASRHGLDKILHYHVGDVSELVTPAEKYDLVFAEHSLHHFSPLGPILQRIRRYLKPDGLFVANEFVGPTRFQWTDRQLDIVNGLLQVLPERYRRVHGINALKSSVHRPGILRMILSDPSEAIESSRITPLIQQEFDVLEQKQLGGTILHLLFADIAHNFLSADEETQLLLELCFAAEDYLLKTSEIESDFMVYVCRRREAARAAA